MVWLKSLVVPGQAAPAQAPNAGPKGVSLKGSRCRWPESGRRAQDAGRRGSGRAENVAWLVFAAWNHPHDSRKTL